MKLLIYSMNKRYMFNYVVIGNKDDIKKAIIDI